jgi:cytoskeleton protein RodZ
MTTMSSERAEEPMTPDSQGGSPGRILAAQREAMGWTVEQVADQLKLAVRQVVALEAGDYAALPSPAVTRGFVRAYAKLVRVDPAPLVAQIAIESPPEAEMNTSATRRPVQASFSQAKFPSHGKRSSLPLGWIAAAVVVAGAAAAAWHFGLIPLKQHSEATMATPAATHGASADTVNGSSTETLQNPSVPLISVPGQASAPAQADAAAAGATGAVVNVPATTATGAPPTTLPAAPANPATAQPPSAQPGAAQTAAVTSTAAPAAAASAGANALVLTVREDAWIEVRPAKGGNPMIKRLVKAGSTETVNVDQPVRVIVGNPGSVSASLRGAPVALPLVPGKQYSLVNLQ